MDVCMYDVLNQLAQLMSLGRWDSAKMTALQGWNDQIR